MSDQNMNLTSEGESADPVVRLLDKIEQHLARIAGALESLTGDTTTVRKELGFTRSMSMPVRKQGNTSTEDVG